MANEFVHITKGTSLTQAEFEHIDLHKCNSQATGDLIYASSATQLSRLAIGAADTVLTCNGTIPAWSATPILNTAVAKGTWTSSGIWTIPAVTLNGTVTLSGNVFDAGAGSAQINTTGNEGLTIQSTTGTNAGVAVTAKHATASPANNDLPYTLYVYGKDNLGNDTLYVTYQTQIVNVADGAEEAKALWHLINGGADNEAMTLSGAGGLAVDLDNGGTDYYVALFDDYDDALVLRQGIQQNNRELLADIGILERKNTGSGYMMKVQPMVRLLAGGIYQSRAMIDSLQEKVAQLESKLMLLEVGNG